MSHIMSPYHLFELSCFAAADTDFRLPCSLGESLADLVEDIRMELFGGDVIDHGDGLGANTEDVVNVHRDAIYSDGVVFSEHLCDEHLGADAIGGKRQALSPSEVEDVCEMPQTQDGATDEAFPEGERRGHVLQQALQ